MSLGVETLLDGIASHAMTLGVFERVNTHEYKSAPGKGLFAEIWIENIAPYPQGSGLAATTAVLVFNVRVRSDMVQEPQDAIDPAIINAVDLLFTAYSGDFTLGGAVRDIDLLGETGNQLRADAGYLNQDNRIFRIMTITLPIVVNDAWEQAQ